MDVNEDNMLLQVYKNRLTEEELKFIKENTNIINGYQCSKSLQAMFNERYEDTLSQQFTDIEYDRLSPPTTYLHCYFLPIVLLVVTEDDIDFIVQKPTHVALHPTKIRLEKNCYYILRNVYCNSFILSPDQKNDKRPLVYILRTKSNFFS